MKLIWKDVQLVDNSLFDENVKEFGGLTTGMKEYLVSSWMVSRPYIEPGIYELGMLTQLCWAVTMVC